MFVDSFAEISWLILIRPYECGGGAAHDAGGVEADQEPRHQEALRVPAQGQGAARPPAHQQVGPPVDGQAAAQLAQDVQPGQTSD